MNQRGFSLLEILVSFSILALSLGVLMQIFGNATRNASLTQDQILATTLAQSLLTAAGATVPLESGEINGSFDDRLRWKVSVTPYEDPAEDNGSSAGTGMPLLSLWQISASVSWSEGHGVPGRSVTLSTLRTNPRGVR